MQRWKIAISLLACLVTSCAGRSDSGPASGSLEAKELVRTALEAWKQGRGEPLRAGGQPLRFDDEDEQAGLKLVSYEIPATAPEWTEQAGLSVTLSLRDRQGRPIVCHATYLVTRSPELVISRED